MKTIIIIENEALELEALVRLFEQWQNKINILTAREERAAISIMSQQHVDLVICDLLLPANKSLKNFSLLTNSYPYIPSIALMPEINPRSEEAMEQGASHCLTKPYNNSELLLFADELLNIATSGTVKGIPVHSFLQMLESEEKSCTLQVDTLNDTGFLYIQDGILISAETKNFTGIEAAYLILSWQKTVMRIRHFNGQRKQQITTPLISIIMEAFRLKTERDKFKRNRSNEQKHQLPLKHISTLGKRIPLEIGSRVKLEFPDYDSLVEGQMIGMLQEKCLIITNPHPFAGLDDLVGGVRRIIVKYVHKGRVWMFKAQLLKTIESPAKLLFLEYPGVLHYHELRRAKRTEIFVPATIHLDGQEILYCVLVDLSITGCLCRIKHEKSPVAHPDINSDITLNCLLPGLTDEQRITGKVRNMKVKEKETHIGIELINLQPHLSDTIGRYLYSLESLGN